ncbi:MAG TPA: hypothetical protein VKB09_09710 [Thermomicrobiales bacterium]|nr:hypothetical protein [Thermomicrobiales bacterium]
MTDPADQIDLPEDAAESPSSPQDIASAARSCSVILIILAAIALFLCLVLGIAKLM